MTLTTLTIKKLEIDFSIEIISEKNVQQTIRVQANSIGPIAELSRKEIDFGTVQVLKNYSQTITLTNKSEIKADFYAFTKNQNSIFKSM